MKVKRFNKIKCVCKSCLSSSQIDYFGGYNLSPWKKNIALNFHMLLNDNVQ